MIYLREIKKSRCVLNYKDKFTFKFAIEMELLVHLIPLFGMGPFPKSCGCLVCLCINECFAMAPVSKDKYHSWLSLVEFRAVVCRTH